MTRPTICLNMIVKNEAPVIRRCLDTVRPFIDTWVIVDTGSTDGTQEIIREHLKDLPGELVERPWVDFAHNRSEALEAARDRADYTLVIDADETLECDPGFEMPTLTHDSYHLEVHFAGCTYLRKAVVRNTLPWRYEGVLHEYMCCDQPHDEGFIAGLRTVPHPDGARARDPNTYRNDALMLEKALIEDPTNARYMFYLGQSYRDAGDLEMAVRSYKRRVEMSGWADETWFSLYQIAVAYERMQKPWPEVLEAYLAAYEYMNDRAGPLYRIGMHYQAEGAYRTAHMFLAQAMRIPTPQPDRLFVETTIYNFLLPLEYAVACFYVGDHRTAIEVNNRLLSDGGLPASLVDQVIRNRRFSLDALFPKPATETAPSSVRVCIAAPASALSRLDDVLESLTRQTDVEFSAVVLAEEEAKVRLPDDPRFEIRRGPGDWTEAVAAEAAGMPPGDVILMLPPLVKLAASDALSGWCAAFADPGCEAAFGQIRDASGMPGRARPPCDEADLAAQASALVEGGAIAFRAGLAAKAASLSPGPLLQTAGYKACRYLDQTLTARLVAPERRAAAAPSVELPKISCLMVTYDRLSLAKRSIDCFAAQTYPNRELVVVTNGTTQFCDALRAHADATGIEARFVHLTDDALTLGRLRNISLDNAGGEIVCQWDDDDCNHPERLAIQAQHMFRNNAAACLMTDHLQFLQDSGVVVWVDWTLGGRERVDQLLPGTVMMHRDVRFRYPEAGEYAARGEDSAFLYDLYAKVPVASLVDHGHLYLYTFHGRNTFSKEHHHHLSTYSRTAAAVTAEEQRIREALSHYPIEKPIVVGGRDGPAFVL